MASDLDIRKTNRRLWRVQVPAGDFNRLKRVEKLAGELVALLVEYFNWASKPPWEAPKFDNDDWTKRVGAAIAKARELQAETGKGAA
jgi:hypothetical protein